MASLLQEGLMFFYNETYYGKNSYLLDIEKQFLGIKDLVEKRQNPNDSKYIENIKKDIIALFNFEDVKLIIKPEDRIFEFATCPIFWNYLKPKKEEFALIRNKNGIRWKKSNGKCLFIYMSSFAVKLLTNEELVACLLHEIGHNFYLVEDSYKMLLENYFKTTKIVAIICILSIAHLPYGIYCLWKIKQIKKKGMHNFIYKEFEKDLKNYEKILNKRTPKKSFFIKLYNIADILFSSLLNIICSPIVITSLKFGITSSLKSDDLNYQNEEFSDNFAASYGYAKEIFSTFDDKRKFHNTVNDVDDLPIIGYLNQFNEVLGEFSTLSDCHPQNFLRCEKMIKKLEFELNKNKKNLPPKEIKNVEQQLIKMKKMLAEAKKSEGAKNNGNILTGLKEMLKKYAKELDKNRHNKNTEEDIFDFDEKMIKDYIKDESLNINFQKDYFL